MRNSALLLITMMFLSQFAYAVAFSFRVQCSSDRKENLIQVFNKIPDRKSYTLPTGATIYFSGGYFFELEEALERLEEVHQLGIEDAFIRVFKNHSFLSEQVSNNLLQQLMQEYEHPKVTYDSAYMAVTKEKITRKKKQYYNIVEVDKTNQLGESPRASSQAKVETSTPRSSSEKVGELKEEVKIIASIDELGERVRVRELPQYKVLIAKKEGKGQDPAVLSELNEIIYEHKNGNVLYYTVGYFESCAQAENALYTYQKNLMKPELKVVGIYGGSVVSKDLAKDLEAMYYEQKKKN